MNDDEDLGNLYRRALTSLPGGQLDSAGARASARRRRHKRNLTAGVVGATVVAAAVAIPALQPHQILGTPAAQSPPSTAPAAPTPSTVETLQQTAPERATMPLGVVKTEAVVERCHAAFGAAAPVRRIDLAVESVVTGPAVLFTGEDGVSYACDDHGSNPYDGPGSTTRLRDKLGRTTPAIRTTGGDVTRSVRADGTLSATTTAAYYVAGSVYRIQVRIVAGDLRGAWFDAYVHDGYAYAGAKIAISDVSREADTGSGNDVKLTVEDRALDRAGRQLTIAEPPR